MIHRLFIRKADRARVNQLFNWFSVRSKKDKAALSLNGCGPRVAGWAVPELAFHDACNLHDLMYNMGGVERDRRVADAVFLDLMLGNLWINYSRRRLHKRLWLRASAHLYFWAVRFFGGATFQYGTRDTLDDVSKALYRLRGTR